MTPTRMLAASLAVLAALSGCTRGPDIRPAPPTSSALVHRVGAIEGFYAPESVRYDSLQDVYFVSAMVGLGSDKDGQAYIARVSAADWFKSDILAQGGKKGVQLNAPKGMAIHGDTLWVADIDVLRGFDRRTGAPLGTIDFRPLRPVLLNDVAVAPDGSIYVTDTGIIMAEAGVIYRGGDRVYRVGPGHAVQVVAQGNALGRPNGVTWDPASKKMVVVSFAPFKGDVYGLVPGQNARAVMASGKGKFDGVVSLGDGRLLVTSWTDSTVTLVQNGRTRPIIRELPNPADLGLDTRRHRIMVPLGVMGRVEVWQLMK